MSFKGGKPSYMTGGKVGLKRRARAKAASLPDVAKDNIKAASKPVASPEMGIK